MERTGKRLDDINGTLRFSQKHIQGIKSVFGSLKNYLSGKSLDAPTPSVVSSHLPESSTSSPTLANSLEEVQSRVSSTHPSLQFREIYGNSNSEKSNQGTKNVNTILEKNLDEMSGSLARLKGLALGLSEEIESQNDLIDNITDKSEITHSMLQRQNKDLNHLLKK